VGAYKAVELAGLLNAMAKLSASNPVSCPPPTSAQQPPPPVVTWPRPLLHRLAAQAAAALGRGEGTGEMACNTYCSLAKLGFAPGAELTARLAGRLLELDLATLDAHWLAQVRGRMGRVGGWNRVVSWFGSLATLSFAVHLTVPAPRTHSHKITQTLNAMARHSQDPGPDFLLAARDEVLLRLNRQQLPPLDLAMCASAFGKLRPHPGPFFHRTLLRYTGKQLETIGAAGPQALSLLVGGLGNLQAAAATAQGAGGGGGDDEGGVAAPELVAGLLRLVDARLEDFKPQELANTVAGLGKLRARPDPGLLARAAAVVERRLLHQLGEGPAAVAPSDLASVAFGLRRMRFAPPPSFLAAVQAWSLRVLGRVEARAAARGEGEGEVGGGVTVVAASSDARDVGHALNALVRLGAAVAGAGGLPGDGGASWPGPDVLGRAADVLLGGQLLEAAPLQSLAMVLGAFERFDHHPGPAFVSAAARVGLGTEEEEEEEEQEGQREGAVAAAAAGAPGGESSALHTALLLQALARLGHEPTPAQLDRALARLAPRLGELTPKCLFQTLYALAKWDPAASADTGRRAFLRAWSAQAPKRGLLAALTTPQLVVAAWALRALGYQATPDARVRCVFRIGGVEGMGKCSIGGLGP
jgi:hypothetical protein